ncbi:MAG: hypothetical protein JNJ60_22360 [Rhodocyclaceae bacterium]|nr:hypothetical protein [Rhodocyclaceae bacterium]
MTEFGDIRLWLGWRKRSLVEAADGWGRFKLSLAQNFIPATWQVMTGFGLKVYVPSILSGSIEDGLPDEVALLGYSSRAQQEAGMQTETGRRYGAMHREIFEFGNTARKSRSGWAQAPTPLQPSLRASSPGAAGFFDPCASIYVLLLASPGRLPSSEAILAVMSAQPGSLALWCQPGFAVIWLAVSGHLQADGIRATLRAALPDATLAALHHADAAPQIGPNQPLPMVEQHSWHFRVQAGG